MALEDQRFKASLRERACDGQPDYSRADDDYVR
jgi:hypothetical protein